MNQTTQKYHKIIVELTKDFYRKYYWEEGEDFEADYEYYADIMNYYGSLGPVNISDEYWSIEDMCVALQNNIPRDIVHSWHSDSLEAHMQGAETFINLYNYWKQGK